MYINTVIERIVCYSSVDQKRSEAESSCVFMKSDESIDHTRHLRYNISLTDRMEIFLCLFYHVIISSDILSFAHTLSVIVQLIRRNQKQSPAVCL